MQKAIGRRQEVCKHSLSNSHCIQLLSCWMCGQLIPGLFLRAISLAKVIVCGFSFLLFCHFSRSNKKIFSISNEVDPVHIQNFALHLGSWSFSFFPWSSIIFSFLIYFSPLWQILHFKPKKYTYNLLTLKIFHSIQLFIVTPSPPSHQICKSSGQTIPTPHFPLHPIHQCIVALLFIIKLLLAKATNNFLIINFRSLFFLIEIIPFCNFFLCFCHTPLVFLPFWWAFSFTYFVFPKCIFNNNPENFISYPCSLLLYTPNR